MEINKSPCRPDCPNRVLSVAQNSDGSLMCLQSCVDLALYQSALSKAEKIGLPRHGVCAICRDESEETYCQRCRDRVQADIDRRTNPPPLPDTGFGPKHSGNFIRSDDFTGYKYIIKQKKTAKCYRCPRIIQAGKPCLAKNMSKVRGNYRYLCETCWDEVSKIKEESCVKFKVGDWAENTVNAKTYECIAIVQPGVSPLSLRRSLGAVFTYHNLKGTRATRARESYLFALPMAPKGRTMPVYWPDLSSIRKVEKT